MPRPLGRLSVNLDKHHVRGASGGQYVYWVLRWSDPRTGKRRSQVLGRADDPRARTYLTRRDAHTAQRAKAHDFDLKPGLRGKCPTLGQWITRYNEQRQADQISPGTAKLDDLAFRLLLAYAGPQVRLDELSRADARDFWVKLTGGELAGEAHRSTKRAKSLQTAAKHVRTIAALFAAAVDQEFIPANPFSRLQTTAQDADAAWQYIGAEDYAALVAVMPEPWQRVVALARLAGLTRQDILDLTWSAVDLEARVIKIKRAKTGQPQHVPIDPTLLALLTAWHQARGMSLTDSKVIPEPPYMGNIGRDFARFCTAAKVKVYGKPLHTLRKCAIMDWTRKQPSAQALKLWAGHASLLTTRKFYDQPLPEDMAKAQGSPLMMPRTVPTTATPSTTQTA